MKLLVLFSKRVAIEPLFYKVSTHTITADMHMCADPEESMDHRDLLVAGVFLSLLVK